MSCDGPHDISGEEHRARLILGGIGELAIRGARFGAAGMHAARQVCHEYTLRLEGLLGLRSVPATVAMPPPQNARAPATVCRTAMRHVIPTEESSSVVGGITDTVYLTDEPSFSVLGSVTDTVHLTDKPTAGRAPTNRPPGSVQICTTRARRPAQFTRCSVTLCTAPDHSASGSAR